MDGYQSELLFRFVHFRDQYNLDLLFEKCTDLKIDISDLRPILQVETVLKITKRMI